MPANKHASAYLNAAYERALAAFQDMQPPAYDAFPTSDQFDNAAAHLKDKWVSAMDDFLHALAVEASSNSSSAISTKDRQSLLATAIADSGLLGDVEHEAYELHEREREVA